MRGWMLLGWLLAGVAAYCFVWMGTSHGYAEIIEKNVAELNEKHSDLEIRYSDIGFSGFPFRYESVLKNLEIRQRDYKLTLGDVAFEMRHAEQKRFLVKPQSMQITAKMTAQDPFEVLISEYPLLSVRVGEQSVEGEQSFAQYAVGLPSNITLQISQQSRGERAVGFKLQPIQVPVWQNIPDHPHRAVEIFVLMLDEAFLRSP